MEEAEGRGGRDKREEKGPEMVVWEENKRDGWRERKN